jgi:hypothetical protein
VARLNALSRGAFALLCTLVLFAAPARAQGDVALVEQDIKAGLLYNFLRYTEWPTTQDGAAVVCIFGPDPFAGRLAPMAQRTVNQRPIELRRVRAVSQAGACTLVFVNADERDNWPGLRAQLARSHVLTVSDYDGFAASGGMIEFTRNGRRIGVIINTGAVSAADLVIQDRLLRLAHTVSGPAGR